MYGTGILYPSPSKSIHELPFARSLQGFMKRQHEFYRPLSNNTLHVPGMTNVAARRFAAFDGDYLKKPEGADFKHPVYTKWTAQPLTFDASRLKNIKRMPGFALHSVIDGVGEFEEPADPSKVAAAAKIGAALKGFAARKKAAAARPAASAVAPAGPAAASAAVPAAAPAAAPAAPAPMHPSPKKLASPAAKAAFAKATGVTSATSMGAKLFAARVKKAAEEKAAKAVSAPPSGSGPVSPRVRERLQKAIAASADGSMVAQASGGAALTAAQAFLRTESSAKASAAAALAESRGDPTGAVGGGGRPSLAPSDPTMAEFNAETNYNNLRAKFKLLKASAKKTGRSLAFEQAKKQIDDEIHLDKELTTEEKKAAIRDLAKQFAEA